MVARWRRLPSKESSAGDPGDEPHAPKEGGSRRQNSDRLILPFGGEHPADGQSEGEARQDDRELAELNAGIEADNARHTPRPDNLHLCKRSGEAEAMNEPGHENERATNRERPCIGPWQAGPAVFCDAAARVICRRRSDHRRGDERLNDHRRHPGEAANAGQGEHERNAMSHRKGRKNAKYRTEGARSACNAEKNREQKKEMVEPTANVEETELNEVEKQVIFGAKEGVRWRRRSQDRSFILRARSVLAPRGTNGELTLVFGRSKQICFDANIDRLDRKIEFK